MGIQGISSEIIDQLLTKFTQNNLDLAWKR